MEINLKNRTEHPQSINFVDGSCVIVLPGVEIPADDWNIYKEEFERLKKFFDISEIQTEISIRDVININGGM